MILPKNALLLKIYMGESDRWETLPLYEAIVHKAREAGLSGATVLRGSMGFGASSRIHTTKILDLSNDLPVVVEIVDAEERIRKFAEELRPLFQRGLVTLHSIKVLQYGEANC